MKLNVCLLSICVFALTSLALAQGSVDGKWTGEIQGDGGTRPITLTLSADGGRLTGSIVEGRGAEIAIEAGSFDKNGLKFRTKQTGSGGQVTVNWIGTLKGDAIAFSRVGASSTGAPDERQFTVKRQK